MEKVSPTFSAHLVGVCGSGMKSLAELLLECGWQVSGSDKSPPSEGVNALIKKGLRFHQDHAASHVPSELNWLIYSPAIPASNIERVTAAQLGIPQRSYSQMAGQLMRSKSGICIAGTHGKSTTTAMVGWILTESGMSPSVLIGGELAKFSTNDGASAKLNKISERGRLLCEEHRSGWSGTGDAFVMESCEFDRSFLDFNPTIAAILNIEPDHFDCFEDWQSLVTAFESFAEKVASHGVMIVGGDSKPTVECVRKTKANSVTFGLSSDNNWSSQQIIHGPDGIHFQVRENSAIWGEIKLPLFGSHNVSNSLAAIAICAKIGVAKEDIIRALETFPGVRRRFEIIPPNSHQLARSTGRRSYTLISDYAHHPTAVRATLKSARLRYPKRRIWCVFQPHQVSRTRALMEDFASSFDDADKVLIAPVFAARERPTDERSEASRILAQKIATRNQSRTLKTHQINDSCRFVESLDLIKATLDDEIQPDDVVIIMGAGDIDRLCLQ